MVIVAGYTERPESRAALRRAIEEARLHDATLHVAQILQERPTENPSQVKAWADRIGKLRHDAADLETKLRDEGIDAHVTLLDNDPDPPVRQLLDFCDQVDAELLVIGLRRRTPVGKLVLGSFAQHVLLHASCPVLAIKAPDT